MISAHATTKKIQKNIVKIPLKELKGYDGGGEGHLMQKNTVKEKLNKKTNQNGRQVVLHQY